MLAVAIVAAHPGAGRGDPPARVAADVILRGGTVIDGTARPGAGPTWPCAATGSSRSAHSRPSPARRSSTRRR